MSNAPAAYRKTAGFPFAYLDEYAKKEIRRKLLKALAVPGYQVPYASREMPMGRGFGTGGVQITLSIIAPDDILKVIDQGSDESVNACNLRQFILKTCPGVKPTTRPEEATIVQTRHRIPELPLRKGQILVFQVPYPCPLMYVESSESKRKQMHSEQDYARLLVKLYEDLVHFKEITISSRYPTRIHGVYVMDPSPIPRWDVPKLHQSQAIHLFGAGREKKLYAVPPYTDAVPLAFDDVPFRVEDFTDGGGARRTCVRCGSDDTFLDEFFDNDGRRVYQCSDSDFCNRRAAAKTRNRKEDLCEQRARE